MQHDLVTQFAALAHPQRLAVFRLLMRRYPDRVAAGEIGAAIGARPSTLSAYLSDLEEAGLIDHARQGTSLRYRARLDQVQGLLERMLAEGCRSRIQPAPPPLPGRVRNLLFVGSGNSARSLMAEAILRDMAGSRFEAFSAGVDAGGAPHGPAMAMLRELGHDTGALWSKPAAPFMAADAPRMDMVVTLCDRAANADLPAWPGQPVQVHWGLPDPAGAGTPEALAETYLTLRARLDRLTRLPPALPRAAVQQALDDLAQVGPDP